MKIFARHIAVDMYSCKNDRIKDIDSIHDILKTSIERSGLTCLDMHLKEHDSGQISAIIILDEGHITFHTYPAINYCAVDVFNCDNAAHPERVIVYLRSYFQPEKTKSTFLKRGDFGTIKDMKPKIKTKVAPLRRIRNTSAKVFHLLYRKKK